MAADVEALLTQFLTVETGVRAVEELPPGWPDEAETPTPMILVNEIGGIGQRVPTLDQCAVHIEAFGPDRATTRALAEQIRALVTYVLPTRVFDGGKTTFSLVETTAKPSRLPYGGDVHRYFSAYNMIIHSRA